MNLIRPSGSKRKYDLRITLPDGRKVRFPGDRDSKVAEERGRKIEALVRAKTEGAPIPGWLTPWIENMPEKLALRLISFGLLDRRRIEQKQLIAEHVSRFEETLAHLKSSHKQAAPSKVRRIFECIGSQQYTDLTEDSFTEALDKLKARSGNRKQSKISAKTRREYIGVLKKFCNWMVRTGRAVSNPIAHLKGPGAYSDPTRNRRPVTVSEFDSLMSYLSRTGKYPHQRAEWTGYDRALLYWLAVKSGFRRTELRRLTVAHLDLNSTPPTVAVKAKDAKNATAGKVPIPSELARKLKDYVADRSPASALFPMPCEASMLQTFYRDLAGAGIERVSVTGTVVDFHALRSTAITWWLTEDKLPLKVVQVLARLKTLSLVENYSRGFTLVNCDFLDRGPTFKLADCPDNDSDNQQGGVVAVPPVGPRGGGSSSAAQLPPVAAFVQPGYAT